MSGLRPIGIIEIGNQFLLNKFLFGEDTPRFYKSSRVYKKGDFAVILDDNGKFTIGECIEDDVTGAFDKTKWSVADIQSILSKLTDSTRVVELSDNGPSSQSVKIWFKPIDTSSDTITL